MSPRALQALGDLEARTLSVDGGRLKLEWGVLRARTGEHVEDLLWWDGDRLLGFLGIYAFGPPAVELAGIVDPAARRQGIATALLDAALPLCGDRGYQQALLVTPRGSVAGAAFARTRGAVLEHSEHALMLPGVPTSGPAYSQLSVRPAEAADADDVARLLTAAFGLAPGQERSAEERESTLVAEVAGTVVGTVRLTRDGDVGGVYGFAVDPAWQGRGVGRDVLRRVCHQLRAEGVQRVGLEVAVENDRALGLYTSLGFVEVTTEDYYQLELG